MNSHSRHKGGGSNERSDVNQSKASTHIDRTQPVNTLLNKDSVSYKETVISYEAPQNAQPGSFLVGQQALDTCPATRPAFNQTQNNTLVNSQAQKAGQQYNTYQADIMKFNSLNNGPNYNIRTEEPLLDDRRSESHGQKKIVDPTNIEDMHCHIVTQIQKLRRIAMDLEQKIALQEQEVTNREAGAGEQNASKLDLPQTDSTQQKLHHKATDKSSTAIGGPEGEDDDMMVELCDGEEILGRDY